MSCESSGCQLVFLQIPPMIFLGVQECKVIVYIVGGNCKYGNKLSKKAIANTSHPSCRHDFQLLFALRSALSTWWANWLAALLRKKENKFSVFVHKLWTHFIVIMVSPKFHEQKQNFHFNLFKKQPKNTKMHFLPVFEHMSDSLTTM